MHKEINMHSHICDLCVAFVQDHIRSSLWLSTEDMLKALLTARRPKQHW